MEIAYVLYGEPVPLPRARVTRWGTYTPARAREAKARHAEAATLSKPATWPLGARYAVLVTAYRGSKRRCDADNLFKLATDALIGVLYEDDEQIDRAVIEKRVDAEDPRTEVRVVVL